MTRMWMIVAPTLLLAAATAEANHTKVHVANQASNTVTVNGHCAIGTNRMSGNVTVINTATRVAVATVATGAHPQGVAFSPDSSKAYVTNAASTSVASGTCAVGATMDMNNGGHTPRATPASLAICCDERT
jgi:YVTN family beta-propeller protein